MSSESISVSSSTSAAPSAATAKNADSGAGGCVSITSRCSVQSPPFTTFVGTPGKGMIEPIS